MKAINKNVKEQVILDILKDHIIWHRVKNGMKQILNAYHPGNAYRPDGEEIEFETDYKYSGYGSALKLMGVVAVPIKNGVDIFASLHDILDEILESDDRADVLAERLYIEWLAEIARFYANELVLEQ